MRGEVIPAFGFAQVVVVAFLAHGGGELRIGQGVLGSGVVGRCHASWVVIEDVELVTHDIHPGRGPWQNAAESTRGSGNEHVGWCQSVLVAQQDL